MMHTVPPSSEHRTRRFLAWLLLVALLHLSALLVWLLRAAHQEAIEAAQKETRNLTTLLASRMESDFQRTDGILHYLARRVATQSVTTPDLLWVDALALNSLKDRFDTVSALNVFDAQGRIQNSSNPQVKPFSIADRAHFQALRDNPANITVFSEVQEARVSGEAAIAQLRPVRFMEDGAFAGVVSAILPLQSLTRHLATIDTGPGGVTLLRHTEDFKLITRSPRMNPEDFNQPLPANNPIRQRIEAGERTGSLRYVASIDGMTRIGSFQRLEGFPFYVQVAISEAQYLADWRQLAKGTLFIMGLVWLGFGLIFLRISKAEKHAGRLLARLQKITAQIPGMVYQYQQWPDGRAAFPYSSDGIEHIYFVKPQDVQTDATPVFRKLHPDELLPLKASIDESARTLARWHEEYRVQKPDGTWFWVEGEATPERKPDGSTLWHGYIRDITERKRTEAVLKENEQRLELALHGGDLGLWDWNVPTGQVVFNEHWCAMLGYTLAEIDPHVRSWERLAHPEDEPAIHASLRPHLEGKTDFYECEHRMRHKQGHWVWILDRGRVVERDENGAPLRAVGTHQDITLRKTAEEALQRSNEELEQFAYVASHDLRQPLRMVTSYIGLLEKTLNDRLDADTREMMHFAADGARRMDQMLVSLLEYSRVGRKGEPMTSFHSREAVDEALLFLGPLIEEAQARITLTGEWPVLVASRDELTRLFQNLIGNALKYRDPQRAPIIAVSVAATDEGWHFEVKDNGIGIDPAQFDRLFKVFQRLHARSQYEGTGIGLAVARKIVERHGGQIGVQSDGPGLGCTFAFDLPCVRNTPA